MDANSRAGTARVEAAIRHKSRSRPTFICSRSPSPDPRISPLLSLAPPTDQSITRISRYRLSLMSIANSVLQSGPTEFYTRKLDTCITIAFRYL